MFVQDQQGKMKFPKEKILKAIKANMAAHKKVVKEAQKGFRKQAIGLLEEKLDALRDGEMVAFPIFLQLPEDHLEEYQVMVEMLEMSTDEEISLTHSEYNRYVRDRWDWRSQWLHANAPYSQTATAMVSQAMGEEEN